MKPKALQGVAVTAFKPMGRCPKCRAALYEPSSVAERPNGHFAAMGAAVTKADEFLNRWGHPCTCCGIQKTLAAGRECTDCWNAHVRFEQDEQAPEPEDAA
jgi:hypothetical protein